MLTEKGTPVTLERFNEWKEKRRLRKLEVFIQTEQP